jgi:hypothetical protein
MQNNFHLSLQRLELAIAASHLAVATAKVTDVDTADKLHTSPRQCSVCMAVVTARKPLSAIMNHAKRHSRHKQFQCAHCTYRCVCVRVRRPRVRAQFVRKCARAFAYETETCRPASARTDQSAVCSTRAHTCITRACRYSTDMMKRQWIDEAKRCALGSGH